VTTGRYTNPGFPSSYTGVASGGERDVSTLEVGYGTSEDSVG